MAFNDRKQLLIEEICERYEIDATDVMDNICVARAQNVDQQTELLVEAANLMSQQKFALLVIDSVTHLYRTEYDGRGELAARQQHLGKFLRLCQRLTEEFSIACVVTNQVMAKVDGSAMYGPSTAPIGGHILGHACQTRLSLRKGKAEQRYLKVYDSPNLPEVEGTFQITSGGIQDD